MKHTFLGLMCTLLVLSLPFGVRAIDDDSLVLYLPFDEGSGDKVDDLSGKGNHGTIDGDVDWVKNGKMGAALSFNEMDMAGVVLVNGSESLAIAKSLTVETWVNPSSAGDYRNLLGQVGPLTYFMSIHVSKPSVWFAANGAGGKAWLSTNNVIPLDEWSHVAAVRDFDNEEMLLYINGELDATHAMDGELDINPNTNIWIGNRLDGAWPFGGMLDDFVIYNRVLTEAEIQQDMSEILAVEPGTGKLATTWGSMKELMDGPSKWR